MIVWVNGAFGVGKSTTARELTALFPGSTVFDPETVGQYLRQVLPPEALAGLADFQDLPAWRSLVPDAAAALLAQCPGTLVVPMTLSREDYRDEIFGALAARRIVVHHVLLHCGETILRQRIEADRGDPGARQWRLGHIEVQARARNWLDRDAVPVDTTNLTPRQAAERVAEAVRSGAACRAIVQDPVAPGDTLAAAVLFFDDEGRVLLVDPVYKPGWEFPGGVVEEGEAPSRAAAREVAEELGLTVDPDRLRLLVADWEPHRGPRSGGVRLVFDGGRLTADQVSAVSLPDAELRGWRFAGPEEWPELLQENKLRRLAAAVAAREAAVPRYLEAGAPLG
ncbi:NUDIX domain-containing protein [Streptacidiphilus sp. EB129]|uniref:NUDIX hydrolase n=1 Tax=Streptacidiphilus sp. EB129 TaxID=3156262 RepID=UPI00351976D4